MAIGPVTGGLLLEHFSWSSVFWVNIPIAAIALVARRTSSSRRRGTPTRARSTRSAPCCRSSASAVLLFGIIEGPAEGWTDPLVLAGFVVGAVAIGVRSSLWELHTPTPMLDMRFFKNPRFTAANSAITLTFFAMFGSMFLMTQYWQFVHGYSPLGAGVRMIPFALTMMVVAPLSARVVERLGTKRVVTAGLLDRRRRAAVAVVHRRDDAVPGRHRPVLPDGRRAWA